MDVVRPNHIPHKSKSGMVKGVPSGNSRGRFPNASELVKKMPMHPSRRVDRIDSKVADIVTGTSDKIAKGLCRPPVRKRRMFRCRRSKNKERKADFSDSRVWAGNRLVLSRLNTTDTPIAIRHSAI